MVKFGLLARLFRNLRLLLPLIRDYLKGTYRDVSVKSIVIFILTLAYIISPIDLIPDYIIGLGQIDDVAILAFTDSIKDLLPTATLSVQSSCRSLAPSPKCTSTHPLWLLLS